MMTDTEQIRALENKVTINGTLAELTVKEGTDKNGKNYIMLTGAIQYGESAVERLKFSTYVPALNSKNEPNIKYERCVKWVQTAVPMTANANNATKFSLSGTLQMNYYISETDEVKESLRIIADFFNDYDPIETEYSNAFISFEGRIHSIADEVKNEVPTGRKRMTVVGCDFFKRPVFVKNIIVREEDASALEETYTVGDTASFGLGYYIHKGEVKEAKAMAIGKQRVTQGKDYVELVLENGSEPYEDEKSKISNKIMKIWMEIKEEEIERARQRNANNASSAPANSFRSKATSVNSAPASSAGFTQVEDDDDIPF